MPKEIERKFLVKGESWRELGEGTLYRQGYITTQNESTVRVRVIGEKAYLTLKGKSQGMSRSEYEYEIPFEEAREILEELCDHPQIEKIRYKIYLDNLVWEVDEFLGDNAGLIIAEVELKDEDQVINLPPWLAEEVTTDPRYYNSNLSRFPYRNSSFVR